MKWGLGVAAWVFQDGNYGDFEAGQRIEAAIEFCFDAVERTDERGLPGSTLVEGSRYDLVGRVVVAQHDAWVIDAGILAYCDQAPPAGVSVGATVRGRAYLGVDPFTYFERLAHDARFPAMIYAWRMQRILRAARSTSVSGGASATIWKQVEQTNAWVDDAGHAEYLLECDLLADPPKRSSETAIPT